MTRTCGTCRYGDTAPCGRELSVSCAITGEQRTRTARCDCGMHERVGEGPAKPVAPFEREK